MTGAVHGGVLLPKQRARLLQRDAIVEHSSVFSYAAAATCAHCMLVSPCSALLLSCRRFVACSVRRAAASVCNVMLLCGSVLKRAVIEVAKPSECVALLHGG